MSEQDLEDLYIRSLDAPLKDDENATLLNEMRAHPDWAKRVITYGRIRQFVRPTMPPTFGPFFSSKVIHKIENTGVVIDRQIFAFFKRFQLAALGVAIALLVLNVLFSEQANLASVFGLDSTIAPEEEIVSFDFSETLNDNL